MILHVHTLLPAPTETTCVLITCLVPRDMAQDQAWFYTTEFTRDCKPPACLFRTDSLVWAHDQQSQLRARDQSASQAGCWGRMLRDFQDTAPMFVCRALELVVLCIVRVGPHQGPVVHPTRFTRLAMC